MPATPDMQGESLASVITDGPPMREAAMFGIHGGHANVTDGRYVYMRACVTPDNQPLNEYTLMPTSMRGRFPTDLLQQAELVPPLSFTKGVPVLKVPALAPTNPAAFGSLLFDLETDPRQENPLVDQALELRMARLLVEAMRANDAPHEQYERLGLPATGEVTTEHLVLQAQDLPSGAVAPALDRDALQHSVVATATVRELLADPDSRAVLRAVLGEIVDGPLPPEALEMTLLDIATVTVGMIPPEAVQAIAEQLDGPASAADADGS